MKKLILLIFAVVSIAMSAQAQEIVKYDYSTYTGKPVSKGWVISDNEYKKLYISYNAADSLMKYFQKYDNIVQKFDSLNKELPKQYEDRLKDKDKTILDQQATIGGMQVLLNQSNDEHKKIQRSFIHIGKSKIHIGTMIKVGVTVGVMGYLIGKI